MYVVRAADALGIPFLTPYLAGNRSEDFAHGANFAVGGATALGHDYFRSKKLDARFTPYSLQWQIRWLKKVLGMVSSQQGDDHSSLDLGLQYTQCTLCNVRDMNAVPGSLHTQRKTTLR